MSSGEEIKEKIRESGGRCFSGSLGGSQLREA